MKLLGVPATIWGILCLVLTGVWLIVWPADRAPAAEGLRYFILRWFHAVVWLLLALAAFVYGLNRLGGAQTARYLALASLGVYLIFMLTFITSKAAP